jgi:hypothetical protein
VELYLYSPYAFISMALSTPRKEPFTHNGKGCVDPRVAVEDLEMR